MITVSRNAIKKKTLIMNKKQDVCLDVMFVDDDGPGVCEVDELIDHLRLHALEGDHLHSGLS